ncbi:MAG: PDDEXK nuclease domain-containing protein [Anaerosomatales bacterium]|nr:PDDEXK nuclease domain-containing protein [Anaerosomatales bacterium]
MASRDTDPSTDVVNDALFGEVSDLIDRARARAASAVNTELVMLYWSIGKRVREEVLGGERAEYGSQVVKRLAQRLTECYGRGWSRQNIERMMRFAEWIPEIEKCSPVAGKLTWTNIAELLTISEQPKRDFYLAMCAHEGWTKRTLRDRVSSKLYERTVAARGSAEGVEADIAALAVKGATEPAIIFRDPYVLDFLDLPPQHSESQLEQAILDEVERFMLELGTGFTFVARQKRVIVDSKDYHLDLLFYHRGMRCLVAIELKTRDLEPADFGQMTLYLRWLDRYERLPGEEPPVGIILCARKVAQQVELLGLDSGEVRAAQYLTHEAREQLQRRLAALE